MQSHGERDHAKYGSSRIHRVLHCAGYVSLAARTPRAASAAADEGTHAHEMLAAHLNGQAVRAFCTEDEWRGIEMVEDYLTKLYIERGDTLLMYVEDENVFPQEVVPAQDAGGIADVLVIDYAAREGWSFEYKFGHVYVSEKRNPQLMYNAVAKWWQQPLSKVHLVVIQPHAHGAEPIRVDTVTPLDLVEFQMRVESAIAAAEQPNAPLSPGPHCRFCECELTCPAREKQAVAAIDPYATRIEHVEGLPLPAAETMPLDRLAYVLRHADALREWLSAAEKEALRRAMEGQDVPEHKLAEARGRRSFNADVEGTAAKLAALTSFAVGPAEFKEEKLIGVTKAEAKLIKHASDTAPTGSKQQAVSEMKDKLAFLTPRSSSGNLVLVPISDSRPAVNRIASGFSGVSLPPIP